MHTSSGFLSSSDSSSGSHFQCPLLTQALCATPPCHLLLGTQALGHHSTSLFLQFQPFPNDTQHSQAGICLRFLHCPSVQERAWPTGKEEIS